MILKPRDLVLVACAVVSMALAAAAGPYLLPKAPWIILLCVIAVVIVAAILDANRRSVNLYRVLRRTLWKVSIAGLPRGPHITRYFMYKRLGSIGDLLPLRAGRVLSISHSSNLGMLMGIHPTEVVEANYPDHNLLSLKFADSSFDFVFSDQVLEHLEGSPQQAVNECFRGLKPGGIAVHTTCFINPVHGSPKDFWRFTPEALALLHRDWSGTIECGGWGNFEVWSVVKDEMRFDGVPHATWHPLHRIAMRNDPLWPIMTWIVARK